MMITALLLALAQDPQIKTDHPWYPGELAMSTFERLFATQAELYKRVVGKAPETDEEKALASWFWRNTHYWHGTEGHEDLWGKGFEAGGDLRTREYWTGLFAHGYGLCGTTHSQWTAEMEYLLGHGRGRGVGVQGHNRLLPNDIGARNHFHIHQRRNRHLPHLRSPAHDDDAFAVNLVETFDDLDPVHDR